MLASRAPKQGYKVIASDGKELGKVKEISETCFRVDAPHQRDYWLARDSVAARSGKVLTLKYAADELDEAKLESSDHSGTHMHSTRKGGALGRLFRLLVVGSASAFVLTNPRRREYVLSMGRKAVNQVRSQLGGRPAGQYMTHENDVMAFGE